MLLPFIPPYWCFDCLAEFPLPSVAMDISLPAGCNYPSIVLAIHYPTPIDDFDLHWNPRHLYQSANPLIDLTCSFTAKAGCDYVCKPIMVVGGKQGGSMLIQLRTMMSQMFDWKMWRHTMSSLFLRWLFVSVIFRANKMTVPPRN